MTAALLSPPQAPLAGAVNGSACQDDETSHTEEKGGNSHSGGAALSKSRFSTAFPHGNADAKADEGHKSTFVDAAAMKEKVRQNLTKPQHVVSDYYKATGLCQEIARSPLFDKMTLTVIALNALWIAFDTDNNKSALLLEAHPVFIIVENLFCAFFTFEWFSRYMAFRRKRDGLKDMWFVFDSFMITMMVLETWFFTIMTLLFLGDGGSAGNTGFLKVARLLRLSRMARMARLLRAMPELMILIKGMLAATRSVFFTLCLLFIIMYIFAIAFTQLSEGTDVGTKYFLDVPKSMKTLLLYGVLIDNIGGLAKDLSTAPFFLSIMFFIFVLIGSLTIMNMLVGVLCEVVSAVAATEQEEMLVTYVNDKLSKVMALLDTDGGGTISKTEFCEILENVDAVRCLNDVGVDVFGLVDLADYIFEEESGLGCEEVELDFSKFMDVVLQLRGTNQATVKDIVDLRKFIRLSMAENYKQTCQMITEVRTYTSVANNLLLGTSAIDKYEGPIAEQIDPGIAKCGIAGDADHFLPQDIACHQRGPMKLPSIPANGHDCPVQYSAAAWKVEGHSSPQMPRPAVQGQLLRTSAEVVAGNGAEGGSFRGDWCPCDMDSSSVEWKMPAEDEKGKHRRVDSMGIGGKLSTANAVVGTALNGLADDKKWRLQSPSLVTSLPAKASMPLDLMVAQVAESSDMLCFQHELDKMCAHLVTNLNDVLAKFLIGIRQAQAQKTNQSLIATPSSQNDSGYCAL
eukprot:TRINITY_DN3490_c0_g1_i2.p1 TRINITY_DN3490_c0_g1~~TRINITY_DN3490_c0_g1_i2.p1  ORF type:complete len:741 (-),score=132.20 TRINITY_DN3490_c0_g1_i2:27-2249(-)